MKSLAEGPRRGPYQRFRRAPDRDGRADLLLGGHIPEPDAAVASRAVANVIKLLTAVGGLGPAGVAGVIGPARWPT